MKNLFIISIAMIIGSSCTKKTLNTTPAIKDTVWDKITIVDSGVVYTDSQLINSNLKAMECIIQNSGNGYTFTLLTVPQKGAYANFPIMMQIGSAMRTGSTVLGVYKELSTVGKLDDCLFNEDFNGGGYFDVDSLIVNIDHIKH